MSDVCFWFVEAPKVAPKYIEKHIYFDGKALKLECQVSSETSFIITSACKEQTSWYF